MRPSLCVAIVVVLTATLMAQTSGWSKGYPPSTRAQPSQWVLLGSTPLLDRPIGKIPISAVQTRLLHSSF